MKTTSSKIQNLVFDFGGVIFLTEPYSGGETTPEERKLITRTVQAIYAEHGPWIEDGGFTIAEYQAEFQERAAALSTERLAIVLRSICEPDPAMMQLLRTAASTYKLYGLANAPHGWTETRRGLHRLDQYLTRVVVSHEVNIRKPDPQIFLHFLRVTDCQAPESLFVDDKKENVEAAEALGFQGLWYKNIIDLQQRLDWQ